jgi:predicted O-linked N-acetylglucosamine transferase (SPINDLY family)
MQFQFEFSEHSPNDEAFRSIANLYSIGAFGDVISAVERTTRENLQHTNLYILKLLAHHARQEFREMSQTAHFLAALRGDDATTLLLLGVTAFCNKSFEQASCLLTKSAQADSCNPVTWLFRARTAFETGDLSEATSLYRVTLALAPDNTAARSELSFCLQIAGEYLEAIKHIDLLRQQAPSPELAVRKLKSVQYLCDFKLYQEVMPELVFCREQPLPPMTTLAFNVSAEQLRDNAIAFSQRTCKAETIPIDRIPHRRSKIRIGYFSSDYHIHAMTVLLGDALSLHDRQRFEVVCFDFSTVNDSASQMNREYVDEYYPIQTLSDRSVAELAREKAIDVAIDLKGWTVNARPSIFQHRAAPIQVAYLGFPGTSGMPEMDYIVADKIIIPEAHQLYYTEKILYMPECYQVNARGSLPITDRSSIRKKCGLPESAFIFCSFNNTFKITPEVFAAWMMILNETPGSLLWLLVNDEYAQINIRAQASHLGINPSRIEFAPSVGHLEYLARLAAADLFLDSWFYNAHTTASDALWAGLPLVTLCGETFASRVAASILTTCNLPELITYSPEQYVRTAIALARSPEVLTSLRTKTIEQRQNSALFNAERWIRHFEQLLVRAVERYDRGYNPASMTLPDVLDS